MALGGGGTQNVTTATAVFLPLEDSGTDSTDAIQSGGLVSRVAYRISGPEGTAAQDFPDVSGRHYDTTGFFSRKAFYEQGGLGIPVSPVLPKSERLRYKEEILQDWEGVVETVGDESFTARLRDLTTNELYPGETAELPIEDISDDDRELLRVGSAFYLTVGRSIGPGGRKERFGRIVFRRLPGWTSSTLQRAEKRAERLSGFLGSAEAPCPPS